MNFDLWDNILNHPLRPLLGLITTTFLLLFAIKYRSKYINLTEIHKKYKEEFERFVRWAIINDYNDRLRETMKNMHQLTHDIDIDYIPKEFKDMFLKKYSSVFGFSNSPEYLKKYIEHNQEDMDSYTEMYSYVENTARVVLRYSFQLHEINSQFKLTKEYFESKIKASE